MQKTGVKLLFIVCFLDFHSTACIRNFGTITTFSIICRLSDNYSLCQTNPFFSKTFVPEYGSYFLYAHFKPHCIQNQNYSPWQYEWMNEWMNEYVLYFLYGNLTLHGHLLCFWWYWVFSHNLFLMVLWVFSHNLLKLPLYLKKKLSVYLSFVREVHMEKKLIFQMHFSLTQNGK